MSFFKFDEDDLFVNTVEAYPEFSFYIQSGTIYVNDRVVVTPDGERSELGVPDGFISLYEYNIKRPSSATIFPFVIKSGRRDCFKSIGTASFNTQYALGDQINSSYNMSASISRYYYGTASSDLTFKENYSIRSKVGALKNVLDHYSIMSPHYSWASGSGQTWSKENQIVNLISIPSILYGSEIQKGSVSLKYYLTGTLIGHLRDENHNGDLIQVGPYSNLPAALNNSGSVAGSVLYKEGIILLTGSWALGDENHHVVYDNVSGSSKWVNFGYGANDGNDVNLWGANHLDDWGVTDGEPTTALSASFLLEYSGTVQVPTMTMFAHAKYGELNNSTNPTFVTSSHGQSITTGSYQYIEQPQEIKNIVHSTFEDEKPTFEKTCYISKIGIYDEHGNLIGITKMATPIRKTEHNQFTFKLKLDL